MKRGLQSALLAICLAPALAFAHPVPFSYVDLRVEPGGLEIGVVVHVFDLAHDLNLQPAETLLSDGALKEHAASVTALVEKRLNVSVDGTPVSSFAWLPPEVIADRQSVRLRAAYRLPRPPGRLDVTVLMFPYDPQHKTFLNVYENRSVTAQAILDANRTTFSYFAGTSQGVWAVLRKFVPAGLHHILIGPDHILFLVGLLLLGGSMRQLLLVATAFTIAHSITLSLAALRMVIPPPNAIEPAIALSVVYIGADNLLVSGGGRDTRAWVAFGFGLIHGFGFANVLRDMDLPSRALGWTLFGFNVGVEIGQLLIVAIVASAFAWIRARSETAGRRLAVAGSVVVLLAGVFWFVQRVFFSGGMA